MWPSVPEYCHHGASKRSNLRLFDYSRLILSFLHLVKILWSTSKIIIGGSGCKSTVYYLHFLKTISQSVLIALKAHFGSEKFSDFAYVLELGKKLLVMASALGRGSGADEGREFIIELHFSVLRGEYLIFFFEVIDFLWISMKIV
jgi:hypothetical protein